VKTTTRFRFALPQRYAGRQPIQVRAGGGHLYYRVAPPTTPRERPVSNTESMGGGARWRLSWCYPEFGRDGYLVRLEQCGELRQLRARGGREFGGSIRPRALQRADTQYQSPADDRRGTTGAGKQRTGTGSWSITESAGWCPAVRSCRHRQCHGTATTWSTGRPLTRAPATCCRRTTTPR